MASDAVLALQPLRHSCSKGSTGSASVRSCSTASSCSGNASIHSFRHQQLHQAHRAASKEKCFQSPLAHCPDASPPGSFLAYGDVVALANRTDGGNGTFRAGEIGQASWKEDGSVRINWRNGSATKTAWPNQSWYRGQPRNAVHTFI